MKAPPSPAQYIAAILNVVGLACLIYAVMRLNSRIRGRTALLILRAIQVGFFLLPLNAIRNLLSDRVPYLKSDLIIALGARSVAFLGFVLALAGLFVLIVWFRRLAAFCATGLLILSPLVPMDFAQAVWKAARYDPRPFQDRPLAPPLNQPGKTSPRVLWVIFDEWDQRLSFVDRPRTLRLDEIDRFRAEALYAPNAYPPGGETTITMPAITTGRYVASFRHQGPGELLIRFRGPGEPVPWGTQPNLFAKARQLGFRTAVLGWYQPYCRVLNWSLDYCQWWEMAAQHNSIGRTLREAVPNEMRTLFETSLLSPFGQSLSTMYQARTYQEMLAESKRIVAHMDFGLVLLHFPVPHAPHAYDRTKGTLTLANLPFKGYYDSLALVDRTLAELRRTMHQAGTWENTTVLLSSDHPYRGAQALDGKEDSRVPFLLKVAGPNKAVVFEPRLNTILTHELILAVLNGSLSGQPDATAWLENHRDLGPPR